LNQHDNPKSACICLRAAGTNQNISRKTKKNDPASLQSCAGQAGQYALVQVDQKRNVFRGYTISSADPSVEPLEVTVKLDKRGGDWRQPDLKDGKRREKMGKDGKRREKTETIVVGRDIF
jgi:ferredoxin-NADP reductase